jgi:hypothetical protein
LGNLFIFPIYSGPKTHSKANLLQVENSIFQSFVELGTKSPDFGPFLPSASMYRELIRETFIGSQHDPGKHVHSVLFAQHQPAVGAAVLFLPVIAKTSYLPGGTPTPR